MKASPKPKICFISYRKQFEIVLANFAKAILNQDIYEITAICIGDHNLKFLDNDEKINIVRLELSKNVNHKWRNFVFSLKLINILKTNNFSIVHIDTSCRYFGLIKILSRSSAKFVYHILSYPVTNSGFARFKNMLTIYLQCIVIDKVIIQSQEIKERWFGIKHLKNTVVIPVGFDKNLFFPIKGDIKSKYKKILNIAESCPIIVYSGVISQFRELEKLIISMSIVCKSYQHAKLLMVGRGNADNSLKSLARSLGIEESIIFTGYVSHNEVVNYVGIADIAISYVPINESYNYNPPLKTFEYLACGMPTIATKTISNKNIIDNGVNGILVSDTPDEISNAVIELLSNSEKRKNISQNARGSISNYDYKYLASNYLVPLYKSLLLRR